MCCDSDSDWEEELEEGAAAFLVLNVAKQRKQVLLVPVFN
jgi:hypothetical protein